MQVLSDFCRAGAGSIRVLGTYLPFSKGVLVTARLVYMSQLPIVVYLISTCRESCRNHSDSSGSEFPNQSAAKARAYDR